MFKRYKLADIPIERKWKGVVKEVKFYYETTAIDVDYYDYSIDMINTLENCIQISIKYKRMDEKNYRQEYGILYLLSDGVIHGQDANGFIDGRIMERENKKIMEIYYRSKTDNLSFSGELELK